MPFILVCTPMVKSPRKLRPEITCLSKGFQRNIGVFASRGGPRAKFLRNFSIMTLKTVWWPKKQPEMPNHSTKSEMCLKLGIHERYMSKKLTLRSKIRRAFEFGLQKLFRTQAHVLQNHSAKVRLRTSHFVMCISIFAERFCISDLFGACRLTLNFDFRCNASGWSGTLSGSKFCLGSRRAPQGLVQTTLITPSVSFFMFYRNQK